MVICKKLFKLSFCYLSSFINELYSFLYSEEEEIQIQAVMDQIQVLINDIKTLKKQFIKNLI